MSSRESNSINQASVSQRPQATAYHRYVEQQRALMAKKDRRDPGVLRQMVIGFLLAASVGVVMMVLGAVFISDAVARNYAMTIMLCVFGMVSGLIIVCATLFLGRLFISRKMRQARGRPPSNQPHSACFHTCSVIYTPSQDQLAQIGYSDPPPAYDSVLRLVVSPAHGSSPLDPGALTTPHPGNGSTQTVMVLPPKYDDIVALPSYE